MKHNQGWWVPWAFLALPLTLYLVWVVFPILQSFTYAFTKGDSLLYGAKFIGFKNFLRLFQDPTFYLALQNNLVWLICFVVIPVPLGLAVALLFNRPTRSANVFKSLLYLPMTLSFAVIGTIWAWIYQPDNGILNGFLRSIGLDSWAHQWTGDPQYMTGALVVVGVWRQVPYIMILYLAALQGVSQDLIEASMIDGAKWWARFRAVILPALAPATVIGVTVSVIDSLRAFDVVYVMTNTKARAAEVLASYMYSSAFQYQDYGYGSAIAVVQFAITLAFIIFYVLRVLQDERARGL